MKIILNCRDRPNWVRYVIKIRYDNDIIDHISLVYAKMEIELLGPIWSGGVYDESQTG